MSSMELSSSGNGHPVQSQSARVRPVPLDDHLLFRESLARLLASEQDFEVVAECATPSEALKSIRGAHVDVVLVDIGLAKVFSPCDRERHRCAGGGYRVEMRRLGYLSGLGFIHLADPSDQ